MPLYIYVNDCPNAALPVKILFRLGYGFTVVLDLCRRVAETEKINATLAAQNADLSAQLQTLLSGQSLLSHLDRRAVCFLLLDVLSSAWRVWADPPACTPPTRAPSRM
jgi:hypothetical protein